MVIAPFSVVHTESRAFVDIFCGKRRSCQEVLTFVYGRTRYLFLSNEFKGIFQFHMEAAKNEWFSVRPVFSMPNEFSQQVFHRPAQLFTTECVNLIFLNDI